MIHPGHCLYHLLPPKTPAVRCRYSPRERQHSFQLSNIDNSCSLKTVLSIDVSLNLDDWILHYSPMCSLNFVHIVRLILFLSNISCN